MNGLITSVNGSIMTCRTDEHIEAMSNSTTKIAYYFKPFCILSNLALLISIGIAIANKKTVGLVEWHEAALCVLYLNTVFAAVGKLGFVDAISMMLYMFFLFLLSNVVFDFFGASSMRYSRVHLNYRITDETLLTILIMYELFLLTVLFMISLKKRRSIIIRINNNPTLERYTTLAVLVLGIPAICEYVLRMIGYAMVSSAYTESYIDDGSTGILSICVMLFRAVIPLYLASMPKGQYKKCCLAVIVVFIISSMFGGSRSTGLIPALFLIWYYVKTGHRVSIARISAFVVAAFIALTLVVSFRGSASSWNVVEQINSDNVAFAMTANALDYRENLVNPRGDTYFISGLVNPIMRYVIKRDAFTGGRNYEYASASFSLDDKVMYAIAPDAFAEGRGFGSSTVLEFYLFAGFVGVVVMTTLYLGASILLEEKSCGKASSLIFYYWWFQAVVFSPRATPLPNFFYIVLSFAIFLAITFLYRRGAKVKADYHQHASGQTLSQSMTTKGLQ